MILPEVLSRENARRLAELQALRETNRTLSAVARVCTRINELWSGQLLVLTTVSAGLQELWADAFIALCHPFKRCGGVVSTRFMFVKPLPFHRQIGPGRRLTAMKNDET